MPFFRRNRIQRRWTRDLPLVAVTPTEPELIEYTHRGEYGEITTRIAGDNRRFPHIQGENQFNFDYTVPITLRAGEPFEIDIRNYVELPHIEKIYITKRPYWLTLEDEFFIRGNVPADFNVGDSLLIDTLVETLYQRGTITFAFNITSFWNNRDRSINAPPPSGQTQTITEIIDIPYQLFCLLITLVLWVVIPIGLSLRNWVCVRFWMISVKMTD